MTPLDDARAAVELADKESRHLSAEDRDRSLRRAEALALIAIAENIGEVCSWLQAISEKLERGY